MSEDECHKCEMMGSIKNGHSYILSTERRDNQHFLVFKVGVYVLFNSHSHIETSLSLVTCGSQSHTEVIVLRFQFSTGPPLTSLFSICNNTKLNNLKLPGVPVYQIVRNISYN